MSALPSGDIRDRHTSRQTNEEHEVPSRHTVCFGREHVNIVANDRRRLHVTWQTDNAAVKKRLHKI